jgi:hypothetical protein
MSEVPTILKTKSVFSHPAPPFFQTIYTLANGHTWGTRCHSWLRHCATSRQVMDLIPDGVTDIILLVALWPWSGLGLLTEMSTRNISWGVKAAGVYG